MTYYKVITTEETILTRYFEQYDKAETYYKVMAKKHLCVEMFFVKDEKTITEDFLKKTF